MNLTETYNKKMIFFNTVPVRLFGHDPSVERPDVIVRMFDQVTNQYVDVGQMQSISTTPRSNTSDVFEL